MKKIIIVGIDFSKGSMHALRYAIGVSNKVGANVMMVHVQKPYREDSVYPDETGIQRKEAKERMEELVESFKDDMKEGKLMFKIRSGKVEKEIINQAKYHDAFLIVAGTHGVSGFEPFWLGSNAYKIVTGAPCPIITIRYGEDAKKNIRKIVLPIDSTKESRQKVPFVTLLAIAFDATIEILGLYSSTANSIKNLVDSYISQVEKYIQKYDVNYNITTIQVDNITDSTIEHAKDIGAELIAIMSEQETTVANILLGPFAQQMVNHSPIPVLTIRAKNLYDYQLK